MNKRRAKAIIDSLKPDDGWWKRDTPRKLEEAIMSLLVSCPWAVVEEAVTTIVWAIESEYGE